MSKNAIKLLSLVAASLISQAAWAQMADEQWPIYTSTYENFTTVGWIWVINADGTATYYNPAYHDAGLTVENQTSTLESFFQIPGLGSGVWIDAGSGVTIGTGTFQPDFEITPIPQQVSEPGLLALLGLGVLGAQFARRGVRRR